MQNLDLGLTGLPCRCYLVRQHVAISMSLLSPELFPGSRVKLTGGNFESPGS